MTDKTDREIMQKALDALMASTLDHNSIISRFFERKRYGIAALLERRKRYAIVALLERLAQPERQPLTDEDIDVVTIKCFGANADLDFHRHHARAIEAKLKEKNV